MTSWQHLCWKISDTVHISKLILWVVRWNWLVSGTCRSDSELCVGNLIDLVILMPHAVLWLRNSINLPLWIPSGRCGTLILLSKHHVHRWRVFKFIATLVKILKLLTLSHLISKGEICAKETYDIPASVKCLIWMLWSLVCIIIDHWASLELVLLSSIQETFNVQHVIRLNHHRMMVFLSSIM